jgi:hypothetical protein
MKIVNPTDSDVYVVIEGTEYSIPARGEITGVKEEHAFHWKKRVHGFLQVQPEPKAEKPKVEEAVEEVAEEVTKKVIKK